MTVSFRKRDDHRAHTRHWGNSTNSTIASAEDANFWTYDYQITDVVGDKGGVHPVISAKDHLTYLRPWGPYHESWGWNYPQDDFLLPISQSSLNSLVPNISGHSATVQSAVNAAFAQIALQVPTEVSVANFLLEANEIKDLIPRLQKNLIRDASGLYLNWNFGWKPFVQDLNTLYNLLKNVNARIDFLKKTYGRWTRVSYYQDLGVDNVASEFVEGSPWQIRYKRVGYKGVFRAGGYLYHTLEGLNGAQGQIRASIAALGLNNISKIAWNSIPYSFVVDWFLGIGSLLDRLAIQPFDGVWQIANVTHSVKIHCDIQVWQEYFLNDGANQPYHVADFSKDVFIRNVGLPVDPGFWLSPNTPSTQQQLLGAALLGVRW